MKLFEKLTAILLSCIMALGLLTACGGGGGGGTPASTLRLSNTPLVTGKVTLEGADADNVSDKLTLGTNGTNTYTRVFNADSDDVILKINPSLYHIDMTEEEREAINISSDSYMQSSMALFEAMLNVRDRLSSVEVGKTTVNATEYYSESITVEISGAKINFAYCFEGNTLKYIVIADGSTSEIALTLRVDSIKGSVDENLLTLDGWLGKTTPTPSKTITVNVSAAPSNGGTVSGAGTYTVGNSVTVKATPNSGYTFKGWQKNGTTVSTSASYTFTASESVTLTAVFEKNAVADGIPVDEAHFPDAKFRSFVSTYIDKDSNGYLSTAERDAVVNVDISYSEITSLKGIEYFTKLEYLDCSHNSLTVKSLNLSSNTALTKLECYGNQLTSLDVSRNTKLESLDCSDNNLTSLDVSHNAALKSLTCTNNNLTSLDVTHNVNLGWLYCEQNQLTNLNLSNNTKLNRLLCDDNRLTNLDISHNTELEILYCGENQLASLDISSNSSLVWLYCADNQLTNLNLSNNTKLEQLNCKGNKITVLDVSDCLGVLPLGTNLIVDNSVTVIFTKSVSVTPEPYDYGTVTGNGGYTKGTEVTVTATPKEGYTFKYWKSGNGSVVSTSASYTFTVTDNIKLYAVFEKIGVKWTYGISSDGTASIKGYDKSGLKPTGNIEFPSTIDGYKVGSIYDNAFMGNTDITGVTFPSTIKVIANGAFRDCTNLKSVTFASGVQRIGNHAFANTRIKTLELPSSLNIIYNNAFSDNTALTTVVIHGAPELYYRMFENCTALKYLQFDSEGVTKIPDYFVSNCVSLQGKNSSNPNELYLPDTVKTIGKSAFFNCKSLQQIYLPQSLTSIEEYAFSGCSNLKCYLTILGFDISKVKIAKGNDCLTKLIKS